MIKKLLKCIRQYKKYTVLTPLFMIGEVAMECILPMVMATLIDRIYSENISELIHYGLLLLSMAGFSLFCGVMSARNAAVSGAGFAANLRHDLFYTVQDFSFSDTDVFSTSSLITRMTTDVENIQMSFMMIIRVAVRSPLMLVFSVIMSFRINSAVASIFLVMVPLLALTLFLIGRTVFPIFRRIFKKYDAMNNAVQENISGIRVVKSFVREEYETKRFEKTSYDVKKDFVHAEKILALNAPAMMFFGYAAMLVICFISSRIIISSGGSSMTAGQLSSFMVYCLQILMSLLMLTMVIVTCVISVESARRITEVLSTSSSLVSPKDGETVVKDASIDFENVSFSYNAQSSEDVQSSEYAQSSEDVLKDITVHIESGQTVGIIGATGSSKTTLIQLIPRLYDVTKGSVKVGKKDVRLYDLNSLRSQVAVVLQKNVLFTGTIRENIRWGKKDATDAEIEQACRIAQADEFIKTFEEGYNTRIERGGANLSGGQKQRLCIARAIISQPKILILDDSTSAVDTRTDALLRRELKENLKNTTKLIIAQRVSSVEDSDLILVMDNGRIVESGNHDSLLAEKGIYYEIWSSQSSMKKVEK